jgi:hypothetical protein
MKMIVIKGTHLSLPPVFRTMSGTYEIEYTFDLPREGYEVDKENQGDWLKLTGVKPYFFSPHISSRMIGFRWDVVAMRYEFCFYWHDPDGSKHYTKPVTASFGFIRVRITSDGRLGGMLTLQVGDVKMPFTGAGQRMYLVNTWWGGSAKMPKTMCFEMTKIK